MMRTMLSIFDAVLGVVVVLSVAHYGNRWLAGAVIAYSLWCFGYGLFRADLI